MTSYEEIFGKLPCPLSTSYVVTLTKPHKKLIAVCHNIEKLLNVLDEIDGLNEYSTGVQHYGCRVDAVMKIDDK